MSQKKKKKNRITLDNICINTTEKTKNIKILTLFRVNGSGSRPYVNSFIKVI